MQAACFRAQRFKRGKFIKPGAERIACASTMDQLEVTAFRNTDGKIAVVVMNRSEEEIKFALKYGGAAAMVDAPARSITTYRFEGS